MEIEEFEPGEAVYKKGDIGRSGPRLKTFWVSGTPKTISLPFIETNEPCLAKRWSPRDLRLCDDFRLRRGRDRRA